MNYLLSDENPSSSLSFSIGHFPPPASVNLACVAHACAVPGEGGNGRHDNTPAFLYALGGLNA